MSDTTATPARDGSHDFDFQTGHWRIRNHRLKERLQGCTEWETFEATQETRLLPGGLGNVDTFLTEHWPGFAGMSLRLYNPSTRKWSIYWVSNRMGALEPPVVGSFENGIRSLRGTPGGGRAAPDPRALHVVEHHQEQRALGAGLLPRMARPGKRTGS
jgi:hypothetical protein